MKPLVIYHGQCTDGFGAAWCFHHNDPLGYEFYAASYGNEPPWSRIKDRDVYLVDFSYPRAVLLKMAETARSIVVLDHHATAKADLAGIEQEANGYAMQVIFDMNRSGAGLAWDFLFPEQPRPALLGHIEDRDLWRFKLPMTREIIMYVNASPYTFENWDVLMGSDAVEMAKITATGAALYRKFEHDVKEVANMTKRMMTIGGYAVPTANVPPFMASDAGNILGVGQPFAATYYDGETYRYFSLRSANDGLDVGLIAKLYGGGGHAHAAGFRVPREHKLAAA